MWLLYLTICSAINVLGIQSKECIVVTPASYATYSQCMTAGLDYTVTLNSPSEGKTVTYVCRKT